jgi:DNA mismatch repair protein MutS
MSAATKPMYRKYADVWRTYSEKYGPRTAVLYQVGGFFEIYDTENLTTGETEANIREIAELCQLSLTVHPVEGAAAQTLFGGFPEHSLAKFERILVQAGFTVVVIVQKKNASGAVEARVVEHIASPGCYVDAAGVRERRLVGVVAESLAATGSGDALRRVYWAAAAMDVATGRIWFVEGTDRDRLHQFLCIHPPSELVIWTDGGGGAAALTEDLRAAAGAVATHVRCLAAGAAAVEEATLDRFWAPCRVRMDWIARLPQARRALAALMEFAADHMPSALAVLGLPEAWIPGGEVRLGNAALEQLGVLSLRGEGDRQSLLAMMDECRSVAGRRLLRSRLLRPICDVTTLNARLDRVDAAGAAGPELTATTERCLRSLYDLSRLWRRLELGTASVGDMACFVRSYEAVAALAGAGWPGLEASSAEREFVDWMLGRWTPAVLTEMAREGISVPVAGLPWPSGLRPSVEAVFAEGRALRQQAEALCREWSALGRGEPLYLDDAEGGGFRITGTTRRVSAVLTALRDGGDTTAVVTKYKATASLEAGRLEALSARHRAWFGRWHGLWAETWAAAQTEIVARGGAGVAATVEAWCADLDVAWTVSRLARDWLWKRPVFLDGAEGSLEVTRLRHPILERLTTVPYVAHSVRLGGTPSGVTTGGADASAGLLLYGMNASGKSSLMKAIGICVLLAQCGFPVPAATCQIVPFTAIFTRILGNDNLWAGQSSFVVEMTEFRDILRFADQKSLVLGDELCKGTESFSATALVAAGVETLAARRAKFVFATHLHELATLPDIAGLASVRPYHLRVTYDAATDRLVYGRDLVPGAGSALYGLEVCRALDLPVGYLDRAMALRQRLAGWEAPHVSGYSAGAVVAACEVCGASGTTAGLESHHIRPQAEAVTAASEGVAIHAAGNLVCLCSRCHDDHHAGRLVVTGWQDTSAGRRLRWSRPVVANTVTVPTDEVTAWVREQRQKKIRVATIQRVAKQIFGIDLTEAAVRAIR